MTLVTIKTYLFPISAAVEWQTGMLLPLVLEGYSIARPLTTSQIPAIESITGIKRRMRERSEGVSRFLK